MFRQMLRKCNVIWARKLLKRSLLVYFLQMETIFSMKNTLLYKIRSEKWIKNGVTIFSYIFNKLTFSKHEQTLNLVCGVEF